MGHSTRATIPHDWYAFTIVNGAVVYHHSDDDPILCQHCGKRIIPNIDGRNTYPGHYDTTDPFC